MVTRSGLGLGLNGIESFDDASVDFGMVARSLESNRNQWDELVQKVAEFILDEIDAQFESGGFHQIPGGFEAFHDTERLGEPVYLQDSGDYRRSWGFDEEPGGGLIVHSSFEDTKHHWHEFGDPNRHGKIPERPVLMITDETLETIDQMFGQHFDSNIWVRLWGRV
jgi:phage gpG-like protein